MYEATENAGVEMNDVARIRNGQNIRRPKNKSNMLQDKPITSCLSRFDSTAYIRLQFLSAVSHSMGAHSVHFVRQMTAAAAATEERTRKLRRQQRLCDHFNGSAADESLHRHQNHFFGFHNIRIFI